MIKGRPRRLDLFEQHRVHCIIGYRVLFSVSVGQHESWIHLRDLFSDQTKLRCSVCITLVVEVTGLSDMIISLASSSVAMSFSVRSAEATVPSCPPSVLVPIGPPP